MPTNIIILSGDSGLKQALADELSKKPDCRVQTQVQSIYQASALLADGEPNIIIVDADEFFMTTAYTQPLCKQFKLLFIAYAQSPSQHSTRTGIPDILLRPSHATIVVFLREINHRIQRFADLAPALASPWPTAKEAIDKVIMIAASTGGTEALHLLLCSLPANVPPILIVQHMPPIFTRLFAKRMDDDCRFTVKEAETGDYLRRGLALVAPGDLHMRLVKRNGMLAVDCVASEKVYGLRPAANVLFESALALTGKNTIGVVLTGMGADGATGLKALREAGAIVIGQDEQSSVVYGMPKAAYDLGAVDYQLPLEKIAGKIMELI